MKKLIGYILAIIGLIALASSIIKEAQTFIVNNLKLTIITKLPELYLIIGSIVIILIGIILITTSQRRGKKSLSELPIYHGKNVVGFRRLGK